MPRKPHVYSLSSGHLPLLTSIPGPSPHGPEALKSSVKFIKAAIFIRKGIGIKRRH